MNNNRNNRRRGRGNRNQGGGNNQNRIDSRARGNAPQLLDKYKKLAQDAQHNGDRVQAEYYLQFADHYFRVIADNKARQDEARAKRNDERGQANDDSDDEDDGDNRRKNSNRRSRSRRDAGDQDGQDNSSPQEGEQGVEGEAASDDEGSSKPRKAKPKRAARKPKADDTDDEPRRKSRGGNGKAKRTGDSDGNTDESGAGEIDSSVLPPSIGVTAASDTASDDDSVKAVG